MLLQCLRAERIKCRRAPVWLAFLLLPVFPAALGTGNYLANLSVLQNGWYSLWTQHTLFAAMFFLPAQFGVFCAWQWRLEHTDHNWNSLMTAPVPARDLYLAKLLTAAGISVLAQLCIGALFVLSGNLACRTFAPPVAAGLIGGIFGLLFLGQGWGYAMPYSLLCLGMRANNPQMQIELLPFLLSCVMYTVLFAVLAIQLMQRREVTTE